MILSNQKKNAVFEKFPRSRNSTFHGKIYTPNMQFTATPEISRNSYPIEFSNDFNSEISKTDETTLELPSSA